jgi:hypothetical protein
VNALPLIPFAGVLALVLAACAPDPGAPVTVDAPAVESVRMADPPAVEAGGEHIARAEAAITEFGARLRSALQERLQAGGPVGAIEFCRSEAPRIATEVAAAHGVRMGRTSERVRNPANAATDWQRPVLDQFADAVAAGEAPAAQRAVLREDLPEGVALRMMRGIGVEPPCTLCHGTATQPEVAAAVAQHYPDDRATGYAVGELRGAFWVEVPDRGGQP